MTQKPDQAETGIRTIYYRRELEPKRIRSLNANRAVAQAVAHMQINHYGSHLCEVYDLETGELHATITRGVRGRLVIDFARDPLSFETRYAIAHVLSL